QQQRRRQEQDQYRPLALSALSAGLAARRDERSGGVRGYRQRGAHGFGEPPASWTEGWKMRAAGPLRGPAVVSVAGLHFHRVRVLDLLRSFVRRDFAGEDRDRP